MNKQFKGASGTPAIFSRPSTGLIIDTHIHTESNNCCPLPIQWGILARKAGILYGRPIKYDRKKVIAITTSIIAQVFTGRFGKIGGLSTDLIGKLFAHSLTKDDLNEGNGWALLPPQKATDSDVTPNNWPAYYETVSKLSPDEIKHSDNANARVALSNLNSISNTSWQRFFNATGNYFEGVKPFRMGLSLSMEFSAATYWGRCGLPIYLIDQGRNKFFINDFAAINISRKKGELIVRVKLEESVVTPQTFFDPNVNTPPQGEPPSGDCTTLFHLHANTTNSGTICQSTKNSVTTQVIN